MYNEVAYIIRHYLTMIKYDTIVYIVDEYEPLWREMSTIYTLFVDKI